MTRYSIFLLAACLATFMSCNPGSTNVTSSESFTPSGKFLNKAILDACPSKMPVDVPHYVMEMNFRGHDTVMLDNGFEKFPLRFAKTDEANTYIISSATLYGDMRFTMNSDSSLFLLDTAWTKQGDGTPFVRSVDIDRETSGIIEKLNECLVTGSYSIYKDGKKQTGRVDILANGQINGLHPKIGYKICYAGDCLEDTEPYSNTIHFTAADGNDQVYSFKMVDNKRVLQFFPVSPPPSDQKGGGLIGPMEFELLSEM